MSALILKSANHLYKLFKVYFALAIFGALGVVFVQLILLNPTVLFLVFLCITALFSFLMLAVRVHKPFNIDLKEEIERLEIEVMKLKAQEQELRQQTEQILPPKLPESLMIVTLPSDIVEHVLGDLGFEFHRLMQRYGRRSAGVWYTFQSMTILVHATGLYFKLSASNSVTRFMKKSSS